MKKTLHIVLLIVIVFSCKSSRTNIENQTVTDVTEYQKEENNLLESKNVNTEFGTNSSGEFVFEGSNNVFEIYSNNSQFFSKNHDVYIIKGNNNIYKIFNSGIVDFSDADPRTYILLGDDQKLVYFYREEPILTEENVSYKYAKWVKSAPDFDYLNNDIPEECDCWVHIEEYESQIAEGRIEGYFKLARLFDLGEHQTPINLNKALELYEYAAANNYVPAIRRLGDIWYNGGFDYTIDKTKGIFYYKWGASLDDGYCIYALSEIY